MDNTTFLQYMRVEKEREKGEGMAMGEEGLKERGR